MERASTNECSKLIGTLFQSGSLCGLSDRELLDRFVDKDGDGDDAIGEAAFEALVKRHGPMVRRVCRSLMDDRDDADDAFQATFLVLARRAASIRDCEAVASWLYGVAGRVVARARSEAKRRQLLERVVAEQARREGEQEKGGPREPMPELHEEVARLPEHYRAPIVLCYLEGQTHEQAARALGCPLRTLQTRLQRGKAKLRLRLVERGLAPEAGLLAVATAGGLYPSSTSASVVTAPGGMLPAGLSESTARVSVQFATARSAGRASAALGLARAVLKSLFWNRLRHTAGLASGLAMGLTLTYFGLAAAVQETGKPASPEAQESGKQADTVAIRVHDDRGRPISGADAWMQTSFDETDGTLGHGTTDAQGRVLMPIPAFWRQHPEDKFGLIWAHAPGRHMATANAWKALAGKVESVELILGPPADTALLVLDPEGHAVAGASVEPRLVKTPVVHYCEAPRFILPSLRAVTGADGRARLPAVPRGDLRSVRIATGALGIQDVTFNDIVESRSMDVQDVVTGPAERIIRLRRTGCIFGRIIADRPEWTRGVKLRVTTFVPSFQGHSVTTAWDGDVGEAEVVSRADGFFVIPAIAAGQARIEIIADPKLRVLPLIPEAKVQSDAITRVEIRLEKTVRLRGAIHMRETGDPVAGVPILIGDGAAKNGVTTISDSQGRYEATTLPGDVTVQVSYTPGSFVQVGDDPLSVRHRVPAGVEVLDLPPLEVVPGVTVQGRLVDAANQPIANVWVSALAATGKRAYGGVETDRDGAFTLKAIPSGVPLRYSCFFAVGLRPGLDRAGEAQIVQENPLLLRAVSSERP